MKIFVRFLLLFVFFPAILFAQQPKRVYITLDVSASMSGNKYVMANYTAQLISVFCDSQDFVSIYYLGKKHDLIDENDYKKLHIRFVQLPAQKSNYHEISDLIQFMHDYKPNDTYQDWLFIIGDGDWNWKGAQGDFSFVTQRFEKFVKDHHIQVCYLQTGDKIDTNYAFTTFLSSLALPGVERRKSDISAESVQENAVYFANKILGNSGRGIHLKAKDKTSIQFSSEFPLEGFRLLYQDHRGSRDEIKVVSATCGVNSIAIKLMGNPTTKPLVESGGSVLSGEVWESRQVIPANKTVTITFNQAVEVENLRLYPSVDVRPSARPMSMRGVTLMESSKSVFELCEKENKFMVKVEVTDKYGKKFSPPLMQKMTVKLDDGTINNHTAHFQTSDTTFVFVLPMAQDTFSYYITVCSSDYFSRVSDVQTVVRTAECPPDLIPLVTLPTQCFKMVKFKDLMEGQTFGGVVNDTLFQRLYAYGFDIQQLQDNLFKDSTSFSLIGDSLCFTQLVKSNWCECTYPDTLRYTIILKSTSGIVIGDKMYEGVIIPISVPVDKRSWFLRCKPYLVSLICSLLFFIYLWALRMKKRFGKDSKIIPYFIDMHGDLVSLGWFLLRKKGFGSWFSRWFLPRDERRMLQSHSPEANITFMATETKNKIQFPVVQFDEQTMSLSGTTIKPKEKFVRLGNHASIEIQKSNGKPDGKLTFIAGNKNDEGGYRIFLGMLMLASLGAIVVTVFKIIQGIL